MILYFYGIFKIFMLNKWSIGIDREVLDVWEVKKEFGLL